MSYSIKLDQIDDFLEQGGDLWVKLICLLIGETLPYSKYINGIRFVDKTKVIPKILISFKYEIWVNPDMKENELNELKEFCFKEFGCQGTIKTINWRTGVEKVLGLNDNITETSYLIFALFCFYD